MERCDCNKRSWSRSTKEKSALGKRHECLDYWNLSTTWWETKGKAPKLGVEAKQEVAPNMATRNRNGRGKASVDKRARRCSKRCYMSKPWIQENSQKNRARRRRGKTPTMCEIWECWRAALHTKAWLEKRRITIGFERVNVALRPMFIDLRIRELTQRKWIETP